jgi:hypothetical protein
LILLTCGVLTFPIYKDYFLHDYTLYREVNAFRQLNHPAGTSRIAFKKFLGLYLGNGNHCDSFIGELRRYTGEQQSIETFYSGKIVADLGVGVTFVENGEFPEQFRQWSLPYRLDSLSAWLDSPAIPHDHLYLVYISDIDLDPGWDFRFS